MVATQQKVRLRPPGKAKVGTVHQHRRHRHAHAIAELLDAVLAFRKVVEASLSSDTRARLRRGDEVYIGVLAAGGFEFAVAILTVLALGAAAVPMCE